MDEHRAWLAARAPQVHFSARILHQELRPQGLAGPLRDDEARAAAASALASCELGSPHSPLMSSRRNFRDPKSTAVLKRDKQR